MNIFEDASLKLKKIGTLKTKTSSKVETSRLSVGFEALDRAMFDPEPCYDAAERLGVKFARCQTAWNLCEKEKGVYDFSMLDSIAGNLLRRGIEPWFNLTYGNSLYMPGAPTSAAVGCIPNLFGEECRRAWCRYVQTLARHFKDRVRYWEIWNEPNHPAFWYPSEPSGEKYAAFTHETVPYIKMEIPDAEIIGCSAGIAVEFLRDCIFAGLGNDIDLFSIHPYSSIPENDFFSSIGSVRRLLRKYAPHVRLIQGECGYPSQTCGHHDRNLAPYHATEETQAKFVLRRIFLDYMADMKIISYFHISDLMENVYRQASGVSRPPVMLGLLHGLEYTPKSSFYAMQNACSLFDGECGAPEELFLSVWPDDLCRRREGVIPQLSITKGAFLRRKYPFYAWYYPEDLQKEWCGDTSLQVGIIPGEGDRALERPVVIDALTGNVYEPTESEYLYGCRLTLKGLPLTDYPVFLTDIRAVDLRQS